MGFSADPLGADPVAVVVAGCDPDVVGSEVDEQPAITRATQAASPAWNTFTVYFASVAYRPNWSSMMPSQIWAASIATFSLMKACWVPV